MLMLVEDDLALSQLLSWELEAHGFQIITIHSLAEARWILAHQEIQALILELDLPDGSGVELINEVSVPVIVISASTELDTEQRVTAAGASAFICKPVSGGQLITQLHRLLTSGNRVEQQGDIR